MEPQIIKQWQVKASKLPDIWTVTLYQDFHFSCDCHSFKYADKHFCKHTQAKRLELENIYGSVGNFIKQLKEYEKSNIS